jgi:predicted dienelactone hydrolase
MNAQIVGDVKSVRWERSGRGVALLIGAVGWMLAVAALAVEVPPSQFGVDAPELARLGDFAVGVRSVELVEPAQVDLLAYDPTRGMAPKHDRHLTVDIWYPARNSIMAQRETYSAAFPAEPPAEATKFSVPGIAVRDAKPEGGNYPLVIVSHGYSNAPAAMTWLTENLASKGYVVAAIRHDDPPITDRSGFPQLLLRRPLDIAFVAKSLQASLAAEHLIDPARTALIGYSMGGYGVLTAGGASLSAASVTAKYVPSGLLLPYTSIGAQRDAVTVKNLRAVVAISPAGGGAMASWGEEGLRGLMAPLLLIAGDNDRTVEYASGAKAFFEAAVNAHRYLLTFKGAGHSIGLNPAPEAMRQRLWDQDWFEDPVWRKERINAINAHFITAFLDLYLKDRAERAAYLNVAVPESSTGDWPAASARVYDAYSPGTDGITVWKGFQRNHQMGLDLRQAAAAAAGAAGAGVVVGPAAGSRP